MKNSFVFLVILCLLPMSIQKQIEPKFLETVDMKVLVEDAQDWSHAVGLIQRTKDHAKISDVAEVPPFALFPSPLPRKIFYQAVAVQETLAELYFKIASDYKFLVDTYREVRKADKTIAILLDILDDVRKKGTHQPIGLMMMRADYMCHAEEYESAEHYELKQIEVNIGAVGGSTCEAATLLHRHVLSKAGLQMVVLPENRTTDTLSEGLYQAWKAFGNDNAIIVTIIGKKGNKTHFEMRATEYKLEELSDGKIRSVYLNLTEANEKLKLADDFTLLLDDKDIVAVVNHRLARLIYSWFIDEEKIAVWTKIEQSTAIKSPSLSMELSGTKKMQQLLAEDGIVERFFPGPEDAQKVRAIRQFQARMWSLENDDEETNAIIKDAILHPERYVLKPNRDGGGNNFWEDDIRNKLQKMEPIERNQFILMQRLRPLITKNFLKCPMEEVRYEDGVVTELSIFGTLLGNQENSKILHNLVGGHMMRTKPRHINEGGVQNGAGFLDSPLLF